MISPGELTQLDWRNPWWLMLALQPWIMYGLLRLRRNRIFHYADAHLLPWTLRGNPGTPSGRLRNLANIFAWLLLACAAADPRLPLVATPEHLSTIPHHAINLMIVLDVSPSMLGEDISPQRLQRAKLKLLDLLPRLRGERIGLIVFSGEAGLLMPLSRDEGALQYYLTLAEPSLFEIPGSNVGAALDLARQSLLAQNPGQHGAVLLLTDGDSSALSAKMLSAAQTATRKLEQAALPLYVLGAGSPAGASIPLIEGGVLQHDGTAVISRLDAAYLTTLAHMGGGKYAGVQDGSGDWDALYEHGILTLPGNRHATDPTQAWQELYAWCLLPAWLLLLYVHLPQKRPSIRPDVAGWLLVGIFSYSVAMPTSRAADNMTAHAAYTAYRSGNYTGAQVLYGRMQGYVAAMGSGAAAYRRHNYAEASSQFTAAMLAARTPAQRADALYNLGNSYFAAGNFRTAADAYQGVLNFRPQDANALANLALTAGRLAAAEKRNPNNAGIIGRRGNQVGGELNQEINNRPVSMEQEKAQSGAEVDLSGQQPEANQARLRSQISNSSASLVESEQAYQAALKKLELTTDKPAQLQKELLKLDAPHNGAEIGELLPW